MCSYFYCEENQLKGETYQKERPHCSLFKSVYLLRLSYVCPFVNAVFHIWNIPLNSVCERWGLRLVWLEGPKRGWLVAGFRSLEICYVKDRETPVSFSFIRGHVALCVRLFFEEVLLQAKRQGIERLLDLNFQSSEPKQAFLCNLIFHPGVCYSSRKPTNPSYVLLTWVWVHLARIWGKEHPMHVISFLPENKLYSYYKLAYPWLSYILSCLKW